MGLHLVDETVKMPELGTEWAVGNLAPLRHELGDRWPACKDELTKELAFGLHFAAAGSGKFGLDALFGRGGRR